MAQSCLYDSSTYPFGSLLFSTRRAKTQNGRKKQGGGAKADAEEAERRRGSRQKAEASSTSAGAETAEDGNAPKAVAA